MTAGIRPRMARSPKPYARLTRFVAFVVFCVLVTLHVYLGLQLFGSSDPWAGLRNDEPVVSGRHPFQFYHATVAARAWWRSHSFACFDPTFQAGYPTTPVFERGGRPVELAALFVRGDMHPAAYKLGLWLVLSILPVGYWLAAAALGLGRWTRLLALAFGILTWWNDPSRRLIEAGEVNALALGVHIVLYLAAVTRCHVRPGPLGWLVLLLTTAGGWYLNPAVWAGLTVIGVGFWVGVGRQHGAAWHLGFLAVNVGAAAASSMWLSDWLRYWWIHLPIQSTTATGPCRTWCELWSSTLLGGAAIDRVAFGLFLLAALVGSAARLTGGRRRACCWLFLATGGAIGLAVAGLLWSPLKQFGNDQFLFATVALAVVPAACACSSLARWVIACPLRCGSLAALLLIAVAACGVILGGQALPRDMTAWGPRPLAIGRPARVTAFVHWAAQNTTPDARIVWEDCTDQEAWTMFLAPWSGRPFLGALGSRAGLEHGHMVLKDGALAGRPIASWSDEDLEGYCRRYNVGWFVCGTEAARARLERFFAAEPLSPPPGWDGRWFFAVRRPHSLLLKGTAREVTAEPQKVTLADVVPENGTVLLSLHYQHGWRVRPGWVRVEREPDPFDPVPFLRLRVPGPVARITLTWAGP
jgi:hypothetical protein